MNEVKMSENYLVRDIPPQIMMIALILIVLLFLCTFYYLYEWDTSKFDNAETQASNYSSVLNRITFGEPSDAAAVKLAANDALQDGKITNGEYKAFMGEYATMKTYSIGTSDYDNARYEADKAELIHMIKHGG